MFINNSLSDLSEKKLSKILANKDNCERQVNHHRYQRNELQSTLKLTTYSF